MSAVPQPRTASAPQSRTPEAARRARRSLAAALLLGALGAALALLSAGQTWGHGATSAAEGAVPLSVTGRDVTAVPSALAVVGLAALVAVFAVRRIGRVLVAALLALSGAGAALAAGFGSADRSALEAKAAKATGLSGAGVTHVTHTGWPYVAVAGGLLLLLAGLLALRHGRRWPAMSGRYERAGQQPGARARRTTAVDPDRPEDLWQALDRGEDPTRDD